MREAQDRLADGVLWIGALDPERRWFDFLPLEHGTTYNSYLVRGSTRTALVDTVHPSFAAPFLERLARLCPAGPDFVVVNHTEPDHAGALAGVLQAYPQAQVVCSRAGAKFLENLLHAGLRPRVVDETARLDLGGRHLRFFITPLLHWPDTMMAYLEEDAILFTCDAFANHFSPSSLWESELPSLEESSRFYYRAIMRPYRDHVQKALARLEGLPLRVIAPSHGPILDRDPAQHLAWYRTWSTPADTAGKAAVVYASAYGNTARLAEAAAAALTAAGIQVRLWDAAREDPSGAADLVDGVQGLLVGSPTIMGDVAHPIWEFLSQLARVPRRGKLAGVFGSYGWSGEAAGILEERLRGLGFRLVVPALRVPLAPASQDLEHIGELAGNFARELETTQEEGPR
jgi:flavorubredoxin